MYKSTFLLAVSAVLFSSCATILNSRTEVVTIKKDSTLKSFTLENKGVFKLSEEKFEVLRKKNQPLGIKGFLNNGDSAKAEVYPRASIAYFANFLTLVPPFIIAGVLVDANKDKKFGYPPTIYLSNTPAGFKVDGYNPIKKGLFQVNLGLTLPYLPGFSVLHKSNGGKALGFYNFIGIGGGLNYYYQNYQYLGLSTAASIAIGIKDNGTTRSYSNIWMWNLQNNRVKNKWEWGYGLSYARTEWRMRQNVNGIRQTVASEISNLLGLSSSVTYKIAQPIGVMLQFQPYFYSFGNHQSYATFQYFAGMSIRFYINMFKIK